jgi:hypothetical protein
MYTGGCSYQLHEMRKHVHRWMLLSVNFNTGAVASRVECMQIYDNEVLAASLCGLKTCQAKEFKSEELSCGFLIVP